MPNSIALASPCRLVSGKNRIAVVKIAGSIEGDAIGAGAGVDRLEPSGHGAMGWVAGEWWRNDTFFGSQENARSTLFP